MQTDLTGQVVAITGAGRGIGRAAALACAAAGAAVLVNDAEAEVAEATAQDIRDAGGKAVAQVGHIGSPEAAAAVVDAALEAFGRLDTFCANAGVLRDSVMWKTSVADFDLVIDTHLRGAFTCGQAAARQMKAAGAGGAIVLVSSVAGQRGNFGQTAYSAAKAAVAALARTWSMELARDGIAVNAIVPTALTRMVATIPGLDEHVAAAERGEPIPDRLRQDLGLGRAEDVAPMLVFLASEAGRAITGQCLGIGGDRLSVWAHPAEAGVALRPGGWTAETIAEAWADGLKAHNQSVGIPNLT
ncbi:MAG: SDR family oxidoreductase [Rhodobacteraceae bacterium]|nr:MAG: SDR family oxidoreductase [Paracoccaceae bacterium]